ncbi:hypothetical protein M7I_0446 [Glarea lozoyensis 74030]|uniref:Uncharacterized protein n=1 Tax=Glarea lozoyensis (strain ATCC 74030 / MF5533) TaxID=1104152 RepID=H0EDD8_GLAL7|nr:hypothetical protein M7I_0446 [Glarea lozoyensis 74030]
MGLFEARKNCPLLQQTEWDRARHTYCIVLATPYEHVRYLPGLCVQPEAHQTGAQLNMDVQLLRGPCVFQQARKIVNLRSDLQPHLSPAPFISNPERKYLAARSEDMEIFENTMLRPFRTSHPFLEALDGVQLLGPLKAREKA